MLVHDYLEHWAAVTPNDLCAEDGERRWTFGELDAQANAVAHGLEALGLGPGDRIAVLAENCLEWLALYYGTFKAGVVLVPLNYRLHPREWIHLVNDSGAQVVIAQGSYVGPMDTVRPELVADHFVVIGGATAGWVPLGDLAVSGDGPVVHRAEEDDDLYQMYTSGTTGRPKGAVLTHRAVDSNMRQIQTALSLGRGSRSLVVMPLFHAGAAVGAFSVIAVGGSMLVRPSFDPFECVRILDEEAITMATFVPAMIQAMLVSVPDVRERSYSRLERIVYGASPIAEETLRRALTAFGCEFVQAYGMTETSATLTFLGADDHRRALDGRVQLLLSCGRPAVGTSIRIVDETGRDVAAGERGEILGRGPQLMRGYWNLPEATDAALQDGWMHTGDAGCLDEDGYLYVSDRIKDMIVSGGENVYPREIEDVIFEMPTIADVAVIGVPDDRWGETVKAIVVARPGAVLTADDVIAWCRDRLAGFKRPRSVEVVGELPRNASGKVLKAELRAPYWEGRDRNVG